MQSSGLVAAKFCWKLNSSDTKSNELILPTAFLLKYGDRLLDTVDMRLRNGYVVPLKLDKSTGVLSGFLVFFLNFELKGGDLLVFEYFGEYYINAHILSADGSEMRYPKRVREIELCYPPLMTLGEDGWRFVKLQSESDCNLDEIKPPVQFLQRCEFALPDEIMYVISNGKTFHGSYCAAEKKFTGLSQVYEIVGVSDLSGFEMMLFEYQVPSTLNISVFDEMMNEIIFPGTPLSIDGNGHFPSIGSSFEIIVSEKHLSENCYFVEIPNKFRDLVNKWNKFQNIFVHSENACWMLQTNKRDDYFCWTIDAGWKNLRDGLNLTVGDVCIFECAAGCYEHFSVRVLAGDATTM